MTCRFPNCTRDARRGWTTCARHYTAGRSLAQDRRAKADEQRRALAFFDARHVSRGNT